MFRNFLLRRRVARHLRAQLAHLDRQHTSRQVARTLSLAA